MLQLISAYVIAALAAEEERRDYERGFAFGRSFVARRRGWL